MQPATRFTQTKKRAGSRMVPAQTPPLKSQGPRRPLGVQSLGPVRYEALRRALHQLDADAER